MGRRDEATTTSCVDLVVAAWLGEVVVRLAAIAHPAPDAAVAAPSPSRLRRPPASGAADWAPGGVAATLDAHAPGLDLTALLDDLHLGEISDAALLEVVAGWERTASWVSARQSDAIAELARRRSRDRTGEFTGDEIATRLAMTRSVAESKVSLAQCLEVAPEVHAALTAGTIDTRKAVVLVEDTAHLGIDGARALQVAVLPAAADLTPPALRARLRRAELTANANAAAERHARAASCRRVTLAPAPDAMAWLTAYLPATDAATIYTALTALATTTEPRTPTTTGTGTTAGTSGGTSVGTSGGTSGATDRRDANRRTGPDAAGAPGDDRGIDERRADALTDLLRAILDTGLTPSGNPLATSHGRRPHLQVTAAATTLLGLDDLPGDLAGYGPLPAHLVRAIAADATWRRIFTDPRTGDTLSAGTRTYRPGADLTRTVLTRDTTCTFPGCRTTAWRCDLDHITPYDHTQDPVDPDRRHRPNRDGPAGEQQTRCENLHALCRHHHRLKTHTGWTVTRDATTGDTHWTAPTRHRYTRPGVPAQPDDRSAALHPPAAHHLPDAAPSNLGPPDLAPPDLAPPDLGLPDLGPPPF